MRVDRPSEGGGSGLLSGPGRRVRPRLSYQPGLDGLRGVAVIAVVAYHGAAVGGLDGLQEWTRGGFLGVSAFFTLSGYLITSLLVVERRTTGAISLGRFWAGRARRLLPASLAVLAAVALLAPVLGTPSQLERLPGDGWSALLEVLNWHQIFTGSEYGEIFGGGPSPLQHFWSLSVEEQVYWILPLVVVATYRAAHRRRRLAAVLGVASVASVAWGVVLSGGEFTSRVYLGTDTRLAEITIGGLAALVLAWRRERPPGSPRRSAAFDVFACGVAGLLVAAWMTVDLRDPILYRGGLALHAVAVCVVIAAVTRPGRLSREALGTLPLVAVGRRSYGLYLIHWPVMVWLTADRLHLGPLPALGVQVAVSAALAWISFAVIEQPVRTGALVLSWRRFAIPAVAVAVVAIGFGRLPVADPSQLVSLEVAQPVVIPTTAPPPPPDTSPDAPATTAPPRQVRVMVVGDSFATSMVTGLQTWALDTGDLAVADATIVGCAFGRGGWSAGIGLRQPFNDECQERDRTLVAQLAEFRPDVVLVAGGMWDVTDRRLAGSSEWTHIGEYTYDRFLTGELVHFRDLLASQGARVVWATTPHFAPRYNPQMFMGPGPYPEAEAPRVDRFNEIVNGVVGSRPEVAERVDVAGWMLAQPGGEFAPNLRVDRVHFTQLSTHKVAEWIAPILVGIGRG